MTNEIIVIKIRVSWLLNQSGMKGSSKSHPIHPLMQWTSNLSLFSLSLIDFKKIEAFKVYFMLRETILSATASAYGSARLPSLFKLLGRKQDIAFDPHLMERKEAKDDFEPLLRRIKMCPWDERDGPGAHGTVER
jgi:hypothetical protein